ncbi:PKD domain-containing protein [Methanolobus sp. ZRKC2]|uniref:PKD domain-containing protein n=1 Tax=Methanolobus sp. ZRKC2 TaxID=3125783 RepID=UPI00324CA22D
MGITQNIKKVALCSVVVIIFLVMSSGMGSAANTIEVADLSSDLTANDLVTLLLGENSTIVVSNITVTGTDLAIGNFTSGGTLGFDTGVVMSSGLVSDIPNPMSSHADTNNGQAGDSDLYTLVGNNTTYDAIVLEFDFVPDKSSLAFNYRFGSEEDFMDTFDDAFGLFVNGENVALLPDGNPVSIFNIREGPYYEAGPLNNCFGGFSIMLTANAEVIPGTLNSMKFAIADMGDSAVDAVVFIEGDSFVSTTSPDSPVSPACEGEINVTNITDLTPEFSWTFSDNDSGDVQAAYQILVGTTEGASDMWDSGKIESSSSADISYAGSALNWGNTYFWRVRTWDNNNAAGTYCVNQTFTTASGPLAPVANFTSNVTSGATPLTVGFSDLSTNTPTSWLWDFGDGNTSTDQDPIHTYASVGTYNVSLNATNVAGSNVNTQISYITVAITPIANFSANVTSGTVPLKVGFTDYSTNSPVSWLWNFGDGNTSTNQNPTHTYAAAGTYNISLNATNVAGSNVSTQISYITTAAIPVADFSANVTSGTIPLSVGFTDISTNSPVSWLWDFGDGNTSTDQNPTHTYTSVGTYNVSLNATNVGGSDISTKLSYITVAIAPVANFTSDVISGTAPLTVTFTDNSTNSPTAWLWDFGDGTNSTSKNTSHTYSSAGTYNVSLNASNVAGSNVSTHVSYITVTAASSSSSGSSNSGSRTSVGPSQPPETVTSTDTSVRHVMGGTSVEFDLSGGDDPVIGISFDAKDNEGVVVTKVQVLDHKPADVAAPKGRSYSIMSIDVGSEGTVSEHNADNIMIRFKVSREWVIENNIDLDTIRLTRFHGEEWQDLPTYQEREEEEFIYFTAETTGFSIFSVVGDTIGEKSVEEETESIVLAKEQTYEPVTEETKDTPGIGVLMGIIFVSFALLVLREKR